MLEERSRRLKWAVGYLVLTHPVVAIIGYPFLRSSMPLAQRPTADIVVCLGLGLITWTLYGAWMRRRWARYPLLVLLVLHFLLGLNEVLELSWGGLVCLSFAAADVIAFDELQKATGLKLPWFLSWLK